MTTSLLTIKAGATAYQQVREQGLRADDVDLLLGASGGPKWFVLQGMDRYLFGDFLSNKSQPLNTLGTSAGAWRFAALGQDDPVAASELFARLYSTQTYSEHPDRHEITREAKKLLERYVPATAIEQILTQDRVHHHFIVARCLRSTAAENKRQVLGLLSSAFANSLNRANLGRYYERVMFHHPHSSLSFCRHWHDLPTRFVELGRSNFAPALLATGSIPMVLEGVRDIPGAPPGVYRDGGITDYHFDVDLSKVDGLVLYPHFHQEVIPGWFDKRMKRRRTTGRDWPNVVFVSPSEQFVKSLPYGKIPDRTDFQKLPAKERIEYWRKAIAAGQRMGDELREVIESGAIRERVSLWQ